MILWSFSHVKSVLDFDWVTLNVLTWDYTLLYFSSQIYSKVTDFYWKFLIYFDIVHVFCLFHWCTRSVTFMYIYFIVEYITDFYFYMYLWLISDSLCSKIDLKFLILLSVPPEYWDSRHVHLYLVYVLATGEEPMDLYIHANMWLSYIISTQPRVLIFVYMFISLSWY